MKEHGVISDGAMYGQKWK